MRRPNTRPPHEARRKAGELVCVWCAAPLASKRLRWCSHVCVLRYKIAKGDQGACRSWLRTDWLDPRFPLRDPFVCAACSIDLSERAIERRRVASGGFGRDHRWEADHVVPIVEGGSHVPENLRALCRPCHLRETRELRARMAAARRGRVGVGGPVA